MKKIYIVEDEAIFALELKQRIHDLGYDVVGIADNGNTAFIEVLSKRPDLILMDINILGDINGIETSRKILSRINVPIIYLTAYSDSLTLEKAKETSPYGYLLKPIEERELFIAIEIALAKHSMEKKIATNEKKLIITLQSLGEGVISTDTNGVITSLNRKAEELSGRLADEAIGTHFRNVFKTKNISSPTIKEILNEDMLSENEINQSKNNSILIRKNGEELYISSNYSPIKDDVGEILGMVVAFTDVTEAHKNSELLIQSEKQYRYVVENATDVIYTTTIRGKFLNVNEAVTKVSGYSKSELESMTIFDLVEPSQIKKVERHFFRQYLAKQRTSYIETPIVTKNGKITWVGQNANLLIQDDQVLGFHIISRDVTERIRMEDELRKSENTLRTIIDILPDRIYLKDNEGKFLLNNKAHLKALGLSSQADAIGKCDYDFRNKEVSSVYESEDKDVLNSDQPLIDKIEKSIDADGNDKWFLKSKLPYKDINYNTLGIVGISRDITKQKLAEEAMKESNLRFQTLAELSPDGIYASDAFGKINYINKATSLISGLTDESAKGDGWMKAVYPDDLDAVIKSWSKTIEQKIKTKLDFRFAKDDGSIVWVMAQAAPELDEKDNLTGVMGTLTDITERKQNEIQIKFLANALKSINDCVSITDMNNNIIFVNQSFCNTYGYEEQDLIGKHITIVRADANKNDNYIDQTLSGGWNGELLNKKKNGELFPVQLSTNPIYDESGNPIALIGVATDISLRKKYEAELIKLNQAIIQSPVSIVITNTAGEIEYANPKAVSMTGYSVNELLGKNPRVLKTAKTSKDTYKALWDTITQGLVWQGEFLNKKKNGDQFWESALISPIKDDLGNITHYLAFKDDITERKQLELNLIEAKDKAEAASTLKDAFIANMSHEIRTPLNGILGMTAIIKDIFEHQIKEDELQFFEAIQRASQRIIRTVDMILNYSRLQVGEFKSEKSLLRLDKLVEEQVKDFMVVAKQKGIELGYENQVGEIELYSDSFCVIQSFVNLIDNAIKYTNKGYVQIRLLKDGDKNISVEVSDSGIGISEEYFSQLFNPYTQEEVGYTRAYEGVGLGLSLVKKYLSLIEAEITVKSKKDVGSTFTITFSNDVSTSNMNTRESMSPNIDVDEDKVRRHNLKKPFVLIVEDDETNQLYLSTKLKNLFSYEVVDSATKAMGILNTKKVEIILMDISLKGGMNGIELTSALKETVEYKNIPIIAVTGHAFEKDKERCLNAGCDDFIAKPFNIEELLEKMKLLLE